MVAAGRLGQCYSLVSVPGSRAASLLGLRVLEFLSRSWAITGVPASGQACVLGFQHLTVWLLWLFLVFNFLLLSFPLLTLPCPLSRTVCSAASSCYGHCHWCLCQGGSYCPSLTISTTVSCQTWSPTPSAAAAHLATLPLSQLDLLTARLPWLLSLCCLCPCCHCTVRCAFLPVTSSGCTTQGGKARLLERLSLDVRLRH